MFVPNILNIATEGKELYYAGIGAPLTKWGPWFAQEQRKHGDLKSVQENLANLIDPLRLLDIYRFFSGVRKDNRLFLCRTVIYVLITAVNCGFWFARILCFGINHVFVILNIEMLKGQIPRSLCVLENRCYCVSA